MKQSGRQARSGATEGPRMTERELDKRAGSERERERGVSERWPLTHLVGQGHKRRCLPGVQWSMKPPAECNRRSLEPPCSSAHSPARRQASEGRPADNENHRPAHAVRCQGRGRPGGGGVGGRLPKQWRRVEKVESAV